MTRSHDLPLDTAGYRSGVQMQQIFCNLQRFNHYQCAHCLDATSDINTVQPSTKNHTDPNTTTTQLSLDCPKQADEVSILQGLICENKKNGCFLTSVRYVPSHHLCG